MSNDLWILDGNYNNTLEMRVKEADTIFYFDFPTELCVEGIKERVGKKRSDIPWVEEKLDPDFLRFVECFREESRPGIESILEQYKNKKIHRFANRNEVEKFFSSL